MSCSVWFLVIRHAKRRVRSKSMQAVMFSLVLTLPMCVCVCACVCACVYLLISPPPCLYYCCDDNFECVRMLFVQSGKGVAMPPMMYGTAWKKERTEDLVLQALKAGFRCFAHVFLPSCVRMFRNLSMLTCVSCLDGWIHVHERAFLHANIRTSINIVPAHSSNSST